MKPAPFDHVAVATVDEAVAVLAGDPHARILAGGQSLVPLMASRIVRPTVVVDVNDLGLDHVELELELGDGDSGGNVLRLGALVRQRTLERDPLVRRAAPLLAAAARWVGHPAVRHRGTLGGSLAHADPAAELPAAVVALGGQVVVQGPHDRLNVAASALAVGPFTTAVDHDEMVVEIVVPAAGDRHGAAFCEWAPRHARPGARPRGGLRRRRPGRRLQGDDHNLGNPVLYFSGVAPSLVTIGWLSGAYDFGAVGFDLRCVATTTAPIGAYRGFGQPQAHASTERVLDRIAASLGLDPVEVRRRNLVPDEPRPWVTGSGGRIDVGPLGDHLDQLVAKFDMAGWRQRQSAARAAGRYVGIGVSALVQGTAPTQYGVAGRFGSFEAAAVSVLPDGRVTVIVGTKSQGQAHETVLSQVAASALGVGPAWVTVSDGDTDALPYGMGTWGSRTAVMGGGAVLRAAEQVRRKADAIAAAMDGTPSLAEVAAEAWWRPHRLPAGTDAGLTATVVYTPGGTTPVPDERGRTNFDETSGAYMTAVAVEVDTATGQVTVLDAVLVSDCGVVINPMVVEGQHQGGFAQDLGAVLLEEVRYADDGTPLTRTFGDYAPPTAVEVPVLRVVHRETPSALAGGFRGMSEATITAAPAALAGAVADARAPLGIHITSTRLHPAHLRALLRDAGHTPDPAAFARAGSVVV